MSMTLTVDQSTQIELPEGLYWADRFAWTPVISNVAVSINGTLVIQEAAQTGGRPITLEGGLDVCWTPRSIIEQLYAAASVAGRIMTLDLGTDGGTHSVIWRRDQEPISAVPLVRRPDEDEESLFAILALRFIKVE